MKNIIVLIALAIFIISCSSAQKQDSKSNESSDASYVIPTEMSSYSTAYFSNGCFWCVEAIYESTNGVKEAISGYAGGHTLNPEYRQVGSGATGHAETNLIYYDPKVISYQQLVDIFFGTGDPTTPNQQGPDKGTAYRSMIHYQNEEEKGIIEAAIKRLTQEMTYVNPIITEVVPFDKFYEAEDYHQNYERLHPENPYVQSVSIPRLNRYKMKFPSLVKE